MTKLDALLILSNDNVAHLIRRMKLKVWVGSQIEWVKTQSVCQKTLLFSSRLIFLYFGNGERE